MITVINVIDVREIAAGVFALALDFDYSVRVLYRNRAQEKVEAGKERGVDANTQTKSDNGNQRKGRFLEQHSRAVAQILPKVRHGIISLQAQTHTTVYLAMIRQGMDRFILAGKVIKHCARALSL